MILKDNLIKTTKFIGFTFIFLVALKLMGSSFKYLGSDFGETLLQAGSDPILGLFLGMLTTAVIQSSSSTTSIIVSMVATGILSIENAVPMIFGANIGTSVTSSIMAFGHIGVKKEYRKAVAAATVHDFFNILAVIILLPLELLFGLVSKPAIFLANNLGANLEVSNDTYNPLTYTVKPISKLLIELMQENYYLCLALSLVLLFIALRGITAAFKGTINSKFNSRGNKRDMFKTKYSALGWGFGLTALVQSSSITSSLIVPFVVSRRVNLQKAFPFLMGANIGTTLTSIIAALSSGKIEGLTIAFVHLMFNLLGVLIFFPYKTMSNIPIIIAKKLGKLSYENRLIGIGYVLVTFFLLPLTLYFLTK